MGFGMVGRMTGTYLDSIAGCVSPYGWMAAGFPPELSLRQIGFWLDWTRIWRCAGCVCPCKCVDNGKGRDSLHPMGLRLNRLLSGTAVDCILRFLVLTIKALPRGVQRIWSSTKSLQKAVDLQDAIKNCANVKRMWFI